jgi:putative transposase
MHVHDHLTAEQLRDLARAHAHTHRTWVRYQAVVLAKAGRTAEGIAEALGCSRRAVQQWVARYNGGGPNALRERPHTGRPPRVPPDQIARLKQRLDEPPRPGDGTCVLRGADIRRILEHEFGILLSLRGVYLLLDRIGYSSLVPRPQHKDADKEVQALFKEVVLDHLQAIAEAHEGERVEIFFEDEARFGQQGTITRVWAPRGSRPRAVRQTQYTYLFVLVAVCAATGSASALVMPELNAAVVNLFLEQFAHERPAGVHAVLIWDGAGYHTASALVVPANVSLILLPPYSPELNPVENLWHYLRSHDWSNRVYCGYDELRDEAVRSLCRVCLDAERMKTVCAADYVARSA